MEEPNEATIEFNGTGVVAVSLAAIGRHVRLTGAGSYNCTAGHRAKLDRAYRVPIN
jgi:hypothetical protein